MGKTVEEMYMELINQPFLLEDDTSILSGSGMQYGGEDDSEEFLTSKEIIKTKENLEEHYGIIPQGDGVIEEDVHFKRYTKRREHKYTEKEMEQIRKSCEVTIVHDYGENDIYHISDEEREANDMLAELGMKLGGLKRTYRKVDQYIEAMRIVVQAWEMLEAKGNYIHTRDEFFQMVAEGKIVSNRIIMPKLKRMDNYNVDMIIKYISNPELDPSDLVPIKVEDDFYDDLLTESDETEEDEMLRLLSPEDFQFIEEYEDNPPKIKVRDLPPKLIKNYDRRGFMSSRRKKKLNKNERYIQESLHDILNRIQNNEYNRGRGYAYSSIITDSIFDVKKAEKDIWDDLYFDGSWANENDLFLYDLAVREELLKQHPTNVNYLTFADQELARFFKILEENGINTIDLRRKMDCSSSGVDNIKARAKKKENKKIESALIQRITQLNNSAKFKKIVSKAEEALNKQFDQ